MSTVAVFNQKGGVGKTTTTLNVAAALNAKGKPSLIVDLDPQASLTHALGLRGIPGEASLFAFFKSSKPLAELVRKLPNGVELIPGSFDLSKVEALHSADLSISRRLREGLLQLPGGRHVLLDRAPCPEGPDDEGHFSIRSAVIPRADWGNKREAT